MLCVFVIGFCSCSIIMVHNNSLNFLMNLHSTSSISRKKCIYLQIINQKIKIKNKSSICGLNVAWDGASLNCTG